MAPRGWHALPVLPLALLSSEIPRLALRVSASLAACLKCEWPSFAVTNNGAVDWTWICWCLPAKAGKHQKNGCGESLFSRMDYLAPQFLCSDSVSAVKQNRFGTLKKVSGKLRQMWNGRDEGSSREI